MATWITHLRIAERFQHRFAEADVNLFLLGNIAPDSGMLNDDRLTYTPPGEVSHYRDKNVAHWGNRNLDFYREYIATEKDPGKLAFKWGYFLHLFLDDLWNEYIYWPNKKQFAKEYDADPKFVWEAKKDWYGIDFEFLIANPEWETWTRYQAARYQYDCLEFYPPTNIQNKHADVCEFYSNPEKQDRPDRHLTHEQWESFIVTACAWIQRGFDEVNLKSIEGYENIMQFLSAKQSVDVDTPRP